jgi:predicted methyltransferase
MKSITKSADGAIEYFEDEKFMYAKKNGELYKLAVFDRNFYKLRLYNGIPILEIDGLRMHLVKDFKTPLDYSKAVVRKLGIGEEDSVLDTCTGLGYTSIEASLAAEKVVTCEISRAALTLAEWNPWSSGLFNNKRIEIMEGDISEKIKSFPDISFDAIIHDPPRFSKAGELYSLEFYHELYRILKFTGKLFHYVGSVGKGRGRSIPDEVTKRLVEAGFRDVKYDRKLQGLFCKK